jgi:hypothetical protein
MNKSETRPYERGLKRHNVWSDDVSCINATRSSGMFEFLSEAARQTGSQCVDRPHHHNRATGRHVCCDIRMTQDNNIVSLAAIFLDAGSWWRCG